MRSKFRQELSNTSFLSSQFQLDDKKTTKKPSDLSVDLTTKKKLIDSSKTQTNQRQS